MNRPRKVRQSALQIHPLIAQSLAKKIARPKLSGLEIRAARISGSHSTFPTHKRVKMWLRTKGRGAHVGKKQNAKTKEPGVLYTDGSVVPRKQFNRENR